MFPEVNYCFLIRKYWVLGVEKTTFLSIGPILVNIAGPWRRKNKMKEAREGRREDRMEGWMEGRGEEEGKEYVCVYLRMLP